MSVSTQTPACSHPGCPGAPDERSGPQGACLLHWTDRGKPTDEAVRALRSELAAGRRDFRNAVFPEDTDLSGFEIPADVSFEGAVFGTHVQFDGCRIGDRISFEQAFFGDGVSFRGVRFGDDVSFAGTRFGASLKMEKATFGAKACFREVEIGPRASFRDTTFGEAATFRGAAFGIGARFECTTLGDRSRWEEAELPESIFAGTRLGERSRWEGASLVDALFVEAELGSGACFDGATLTGCALRESSLRSASFREADLFGTDFRHCVLDGADFHLAVVDGRTLVSECSLEHADFTGVGLGQMRLHPVEDLASLEYTMRRRSWERWYAGGRHAETKGIMARTGRRLLAGPVRFFWTLSDYGRSTSRLVSWFAAFAFGFAALYLASTGLFFPGTAGLEPFVQGLSEPLGESPTRLALGIRAVYFSVVTMTTLGYGEISANPASEIGQLVLTLQVLVGYLMLGALVTRLGILLTSRSR